MKFGQWGYQMVGQSFSSVWCVLLVLCQLANITGQKYHNFGVSNPDQLFELYIYVCVCVCVWVQIFWSGSHS